MHTWGGFSKPVQKAPSKKSANPLGSPGVWYVALFFSLWCRTASLGIPKSPTTITKTFFVHIGHVLQIQECTASWKRSPCRVLPNIEELLRKPCPEICDFVYGNLNARVCAYSSFRFCFWNLNGTITNQSQMFTKNWMVCMVMWVCSAGYISKLLIQKS